jgi:hypothetical protein
MASGEYVNVGSGQTDVPSLIRGATEALRGKKETKVGIATASISLSGDARSASNRVLSWKCIFKRLLMPSYAVVFLL